MRIGLGEWLILFLLLGLLPFPLAMLRAGYLSMKNSIKEDVKADLYEEAMQRRGVN